MHRSDNVLLISFVYFSYPLGAGDTETFSNPLAPPTSADIEDGEE